MKSGSRLSRTEWMLLAVLAAVQFTHLVDFMIVMPLGPQYMAKLELSPGQFGLVVSMYGFCASASGLLASRFMDRFDRKRSLLLLYSGFTLATLLCAVADSYVPLVIARGLAGAFGGVVAASVLAIVGDAFPDSRCGTAMGVIMTAFSLALIGGVPAGLFLANHLGWWAPFAGIGSVAAVVTVGMAIVMPPLRGHLERHTDQPPASVWDAFRTPNYWRAYAFTTSLVFGSFTIGPYLAAYMVGNMGRRQDELPWIYLVGGLTTLVTSNVIGPWSDRFGKLRAFRLLAALTIIPLLVMTNLPPVSLAVAIAVSTFFMVVTSGRMVPGTALLTACAGPRSRGQFLAVNASVQQMAAGLAASLGGLIVGEGANNTRYRPVFFAHSSAAGSRGPR